MFTDPLEDPVKIDLQEDDIFENLHFVQIPEHLLSHIVAIDLIYNQEFHFTVDPKGKRVHSNYSNLPSELRPFITVNGKSLHGIDIRNSQPLFFAAFVQQWYKKRRLKVPADAKKYKELCEQGLFYEYMCEEDFNKKEKSYLNKVNLIKK